MSEIDLSKELKKELLESIKGLKNLAGEEIPELAKEIVAYKKVEHTFNSAVMSFFIYLCTLGFDQKFVKELGFDGMAIPIIMLLCSVGILVFMSTVSSEISNGIKAHMAPKNYAISYYINLLKSEPIVNKAS